MSRIIDASLDDLIDRDPTAGDLVLDLPVDLRGQALGHPVISQMLPNNQLRLFHIPRMHQEMHKLNFYFSNS